MFPIVICFCYSVCSLSLPDHIHHQIMYVYYVEQLCLICEHAACFSPCIGIQKKLLFIFSIDSKGCTTKDLHAARAAITSKAAKKAALTTNKEKVKEKTNVKRKAATESETKGRKAKPLRDPSNNNNNDNDHDMADYNHDRDLVDDTDSDGTDGGGDENDGDRECHTHAHQETLMKNHHTLIVKYEEWSET